jgi:general secretion pathway protein E
VLAQWLVRRICDGCRRPVELSSEQRSAFAGARTPVGDAWAGAGCGACRDTGYRGRTGIYELLVMDDELRAALHEDASARSLTALAVERGMRLLRDDGLRLMAAGVTTAEEVLRVSG